MSDNLRLAFFFDPLELVCGDTDALEIGEKGFPNLLPLFSFGQIQIREQLLGPLKRDIIAILVLVLDDRLLMLGKVLHGHDGLFPYK